MKIQSRTYEDTASFEMRTIAWRSARSAEGAILRAAAFSLRRDIRITIVIYLQSSKKPPGRQLNGTRRSVEYRQ